MIAGAGGDVATRAETVLAPCDRRARCRCQAVRAAPICSTRVPGRHRGARHRARRRLHQGLGASGLHRDPGRARARLSGEGVSGKALLEAIVAGYETVTAIGRAVHPDLRHRGFHPTGAVAVFGAAMATGKLLALSSAQLAHAMGIARIEFGGPVRVRQRRRGHQAAARRPCLARRPAGGAARRSRASKVRPACSRRATASCRRSRSSGPSRRAPITLPPEAPWGITDCYIKPNPCCRHIQPATEARDRAAQRREDRDR